MNGGGEFETHLFSYMESVRIMRRGAMSAPTIFPQCPKNMM